MQSLRCCVMNIAACRIHGIERDDKGNGCVLPFHSDMVFGRRDKQTAKHKGYQLYCNHQFYHALARARAHTHKSIYSNQCELNWLVGFVSIGFLKPLSTVRPLLSINCPQKCPNMRHGTCSARECVEVFHSFE